MSLSGSPYQQTVFNQGQTVKQLAPSDQITANGKTQSVNQFAIELGCPVQTILGRLNRGWDVDRAVSTPVGKKGGQNRGTKQAAEVLTSEELQQILDRCNDGDTGKRNRALIVIGWRSGLRITEALSLTPANLDERQQTVRVLHGKGDKSRTVGLDAQSWSVVKTWIDARSLLRGITDQSPLFCTLSGGRVSDRYVRELLPRLAKQCGITKRCHFHGLRHTMAFELASEGVPVHLIQQQLGHSNLAVTSRYIAHLNPAETINRMKGRAWGSDSHTQSPTATNSLPSPDWLTRLRTDIGARLQLIHDSRSDEVNFKAIVLLF